MGAPKSHRIPGGVGQLISWPGLVNPPATETGLTPSLLLLAVQEAATRGAKNGLHGVKSEAPALHIGNGTRGFQRSLPRGLGWTELVVKLGNPEIARQLLLRGADPDLKDRTGFAVLHDAARAGFLDTLQTLLEFGADVNVEDNEGNLPLHLAAQEGHLAVVAFLLERTASRVEHRNKKGATAYDLAKLYKRQAVAKLLENSRRREGALSGD
ncbi:cyclin-dependent kinase 4 inhibitor C isoform X1 [Notechis scutatus]|uniref:Cyclin-dependent kinase 4 inhibitor C isoform X1 n=1 Tax=Notechis scutatus TaxID=8663 RepID=A0A6J1TUF9_9SAUR|nr:cyclin-dependent kinase 4 inhibitor C isoform X1 [Notechis scutatus]